MAQVFACIVAANSDGDEALQRAKAGFESGFNQRQSFMMSFPQL
jgi:hypothetical protein